MILPIVAYGHSILRKKAIDIAPDYPALSTLIQNMWETLYNSNGVGLAAPQINASIRLFLVDSIQIVNGAEEEEKKDYANEKPIKEVFINPTIVKTNGTPWDYQEGCLSIPKIREDVTRAESVELAYLNEQFIPQHATFNGITARIILHEYDHLEGKLFIDYLTPLKKRLLKSKLEDIAKEKIKVDYKMIFAK